MRIARYVLYTHSDTNPRRMTDWEIKPPHPRRIGLLLAARSARKKRKRQDNMIALAMSYMMICWLVAQGKPP